MNTDERLLYEARVRPRQAIIAGLAAVLLIAASIIQLAGPHTTVDEITLDLIVANKRVGLDVLGAAINALGSIALAQTLWWLFGAIRARNPQTQGFTGPLALVGGGLAAIAGVAYAIVIAIKAHQFVTTGSQTYVEANHVTNGSGILALQLVGQGAALLLALAFVLVSLNGLRVGVLTRFMGYLGMFAGALVLFQITQVPVVQAYWLFALGYMLSGRWPTGVPPSWRSGRAEKWPSTQELREQRLRAAGGGGRAATAPASAPDTVPVPAAPANRPTKRKRKRRK